MRTLALSRGMPARAETAFSNSSPSTGQGSALEPRPASPDRVVRGIAFPQRQWTFGQTHRAGGISECLLGLPARADQGMCLGCPHRAGQRVDVVGAAMVFAVDEERRRAGDAAQVGGVHVLGDL